MKKLSLCMLSVSELLHQDRLSTAAYAGQNQNLRSPEPFVLYMTLNINSVRRM